MLPSTEHLSIITDGYSILFATLCLVALPGRPLGIISSNMPEISTDNHCAFPLRQRKLVNDVHACSAQVRRQSLSLALNDKQLLQRASAGKRPAKVVQQQRLAADKLFLALTSPVELRASPLFAKWTNGSLGITGNDGIEGPGNKQSLMHGQSLPDICQATTLHVGVKKRHSANCDVSQLISIR